MNIRTRLSPDEIRTNIMDVAEEHFRRIGYAKTAVADIASALGMSPANVYRFFPSKSAINEAICLRILGEAHAMLDSVAAEPLPAPEKLKKAIRQLYAFNHSRFIQERRVHDMVEAAMEENWGAVEAHLTFVVERFSRIIAEGVREGSFKPCDIQLTALTVKNACTSILHPQMIAECARHGRDMGEMSDRLSAFVVDALRA
jgi:AcrR family transcriptional regulator